MGLSREGLAFHTGLSWSAIAQIEGGRRPNPRAETLASIARALGVTVDYLLGSAAPGTSLLHHHALIYGDADEFVATAGPFVAEGLAGDEATLVVTSPANIDALRDHLGDAAGGVWFAESAGWYGSPRAAFTAYRDFATSSLDRGAPWLRVIGEPVWAGRSDAEVALWARYESLLNLAFGSFPLTLACPYDERALEPEIVEHARATHCHSLVRGETSANAAYKDPAEFCLEE